MCMIRYIPYTLQFETSIPTRYMQLHLHGRLTPVIESTFVVHVYM